MSTKEAIQIVMKDYETRREELRKYRREHQNDIKHTSEYYVCGNEMYALRNKIKNLVEFSKLF